MYLYSINLSISIDIFPPSAKPLYGGKAFKRKTKIAEESANRGGTNWRQFNQGIPVVDASINVPFFPFGM
jgi:hypothetical protein